MKKFIRKIADKLSNYKLLARIMVCVSAFVLVTCALAFVAFQLSKGSNEYGEKIVAFGTTTILDKKKEPIPETHHQVVGMFCFLFFFATLVIAIVNIAKSFKFAMNKGRLSPSKAQPVLVVVNGGLCLVDILFCVLAVVYDGSIIPAFWWVVVALFAIASIASFCFLVPVLKSHYYMPKEEEAK